MAILPVDQMTPERKATVRAFLQNVDPPYLKVDRTVRVWIGHGGERVDAVGFWDSAGKKDNFGRALIQVSARTGNRNVTLTEQNCWYGMIADAGGPCPVGKNFICRINQDWTNPSNNSITFKKNDKVRIEDVHPDRMTALVVRMDRPGKHEIPGAIFDPLHPVVWKNRCVKFRMGKPHTLSNGRKVNIQRGQIAFIQDDSKPGSEETLNLVLNDSEGNTLLTGIDAFAVQYGAFKGQAKLELMDLVKPDMITTADTNRNANLWSPFSDHCFQLLTDIWNNRNRIGNIGEEFLLAIDTEQKRDTLSKDIQAGIAKVSPELLNTFKSAEGFSIDDIIRWGKRVNKQNKTMGVYVRGYGKFGKKSKWKAVKKRFAYTGSAKDMASRVQSHNRDANNPKSAPYRSTHYQIKRDCEEEHVMQVCELPSKYLTSKDGMYDSVVLEITETCLILMLKTYSNRVLSWNLIQQSAAKWDEKELRPKIAATYTPRQLASALSIVAEKSFAKTGWPMHGKKHMHGVEEGLNILTPISGTLNHYEKLLWSSTHISATSTSPGYTIYRREGKLVRKSETRSRGSLRLMGFTRSNGNEFAITIGSDCLGRGLDINTYVDIQIEIMDDTEHACPYWIGPLASPFSNAEDLRKLAIAVRWKHGDQYLRRYVRPNETKWAKNPEDEFRGATLHGRVTMMKAFLEGDTIVDENGRVPQSCWLYHIGFARLLDLNMDPFAGVIQARAKKASGTQRIVTTRTTNSYAAVRGLGIQIGGTYGRIDYSQLEKYLRDNNTGIKATSKKQRSTCDYCYAKGALTSMKVTGCHRKAGTQTCTACDEVGLPCKWSPPQMLLGTDSSSQHTAVSPRAKTVSDTLLALRYGRNRNISTVGAVVKDLAAERSVQLSTAAGEVDIESADLAADLQDDETPEE